MNVHLVGLALVFGFLAIVALGVFVIVALQRRADRREVTR